MAKYKVVMDDYDDDNVFDSREEAEEHAMYLCSCGCEGSETLYMSNPWENDRHACDDMDYRIVRV